MSDPVNQNVAEARRWLRQAEETLSWAQWSAKGQFWAPACFQSQQAAELALKALLIRQGERCRIHGVLGLLEHATQYYPELKSLAGEARRLDRFYIPTRYPDGLVSGIAGENFDQADYGAALDAANKVFQVVRTRLQTDVA